MPKRLRMRRGVNQLTHRTVEIFRQEPVEEKVSHSLVSRVMAEMGRRGGKIGGKRRLVTLAPMRRREIALKAAHARWNRETDKARP